MPVLNDGEWAKVQAILDQQVEDYEHGITAEQELEEKANNDAPMYGPHPFD